MEHSDIYNALVEFPDALDSTIRNQFTLDGIRDICEHSWIFTEVDTFLTTAGTYEYTLTPATTHVEIIGIPHDGVRIASVYTPVLTVSAGTDAGTLAAGTTYAYQVTSYRNNYGETIPQTAESVACPAAGSIDLSWDAVSGVDGYYIYSNGGSGTTYGRLTSTTSTSYTDDGSDSRTATTNPPSTSTLVEYINVRNVFGMKQWSPEWRRTETDDVDYVLFNGIDKVQLSGVPRTTNIGFEIECALKPTSRSTTVPSILERHEETIRKYVKARIYGMPRSNEHPWVDKESAKFWMEEYEKDRRLIKGKKMYGFTGANLKAKFHKFGFR